MEQATIKNKPRPDQLIQMYEAHKSARNNFETFWQTLHDYYYIESMDINKIYAPGRELTVDYLYDATTLDAADVLANGFMTYLTPATSRWSRLRHSNPRYGDNKRVNSFLQDVMDEVFHILDKSNFYSQMWTNYKSSGVYGTSIMLEEDDEKHVAWFYSLPIKNTIIVENSKGQVVAYFIEFEYTAKQAAERWGLQNLSVELMNEATAEKEITKKHTFLLYIAERHFRDLRKSDKENLPIEAVWLDREGRKTMDVGGYHEFPAFCHRFDKRPFIPWGFSPAMKALPFARYLNAAAKTNLRSMMKHTDPPVALPEGAFLMPFNANPRAVNYYRKSKMDSQKDIFAFGNFGNPDVGMEAVKYYGDMVRRIMFNDAFLAFDGLTKQMNNPEVAERINEKMTLLGPSVGRWISENINPTIIRTIGIAYRRGRLPNPPDEFINDPSYEVDCVSQLAQAQRRNELNSLMTGVGYVGQLAQFSPDVMDKIDMDQSVDEVWNILGAPARALRDDETVEKIREAKAQAAAQAQAIAGIQAQANAVKTGSEIDKNLATAGKE